MALRRRIASAFLWLLTGFGILLWLAALLLFSKVAENSDDFAGYSFWVVLVNSVGIAALLTLIVVRLVRLVREYRRYVPGSRLQVRMVSLVVVLTVTPLVVLYIFSVAFINRGIDDWFNVDVDQGLRDALELSQTALEVQRRENLSQLEDVARNITSSDRQSIVRDLGQARVANNADELTLFGANNQILATNSGVDPAAAAVPQFPTEEMLLRLRQEQSFVTLELKPDGQYEIQAAVRVPAPDRPGEYEILRGTYPVDPRISVLANAVQSSYNEFAELAFLSTALKYSFTLTLSLVLLVATLASVYGAFFAARRLIVPIQQLMQGTRAVARGDFDTKLPIKARDEIGFLVNSFNDMTQRLASARQEANQSGQRLESERHKLEVILARLSTGVVSLESDLRIRTANQAAGAILGVDLESHVGDSLVELAASHPLLGQFLMVCEAHLDRSETDWREQMTLRGEVGRRELMCACSELPSEGDRGQGYVVVFDDITVLMQAQREAAWGEVARRLAHEIKNPLTPIQLSAERLRRRYLHSDEKDLDLLDRATHTIIQQVDAMKDMVNAFSEYARAPDIELSQIDLNVLINEVTELYRHQLSPVTIKMSFDGNLPPVNADIGRMRQVLHNLMRNAIEATEGQADAEIDITTRGLRRDDGRYVEITVADNGPGFAEEIIDQAFFPYVTSKAKGTGLGLAIVRKLVEEHGGRIQARNKEQGGAEVSILLPLVGTDEESSPNARPEMKREHA